MIQNIRSACPLAAASRSIPEFRRRATGISIQGGGLALVSFDYTSLEKIKLDAYLNVVWEPLDGSQLSILHLILRLSAFMESKGIAEAHLRHPEGDFATLTPRIMRQMVPAMHSIVDVRIMDVFDVQVSRWVSETKPHINMANVLTGDQLTKSLLQSAAETAIYAAHFGDCLGSFGHA